MLNTAHEMRTPVTAIQGITQSLLRSIANKLSLSPDALTKRLQVIQSATDKLILLSNNLSDLARLQTTGYVRLPRKHCNLNDLVVKEVDRMKNMAATATFTWDTALSLAPLPVFVNEGRIERALNNILENAGKYSIPGGTITVKTMHDGKYATVVIADQGVGIPEEEIEKITDAFYRASNATLINYAGIGFGLFFAKTIIDAHGGSLNFKSEIGQGTTVTIELPLVG